MNESTLSQLKIIVERAVRPVRASTGRKRKMREELLAHVLGVFEEESVMFGDEQTAVERTALRFGSPADVTSQLQESIPARDAVRRYWEGRPGEPAWRTAIRSAWVSGTFALAFVVFLIAIASFAAGWVGTWQREVLIPCLGAVLAVPALLAGLVFLTSWMEKALSGPPGPSWLKFAVAAAGSSLFMVLWSAAVSWPTWSTRPDYLGAVLIAGFVGAPGLVYALAQSSLVCRRYHEEWARLDIA